MAFDNHYKIIGHETALPLIQEWLNSDCANVRRAAHREDQSEYVRKSIGNALRDISKKYPIPVSEELSSWNLSSKEIKQVYKLAGRFLELEGK